MFAMTSSSEVKFNLKNAKNQQKKYMYLKGCDFFKNCFRAGILTYIIPVTKMILWWKRSKMQKKGTNLLK